MLRLKVAPLVVAVAAGALVCGCSPPFAQALLEELDRTVTFTELVRDPDRHRGRTVMVGGTIVEVKNLKEGTQVEMLQKPLDGEGRPAMTDESGGRFLIIVPQFLDAAVYHRGRSLTAIGTVDGSKMQLLGEIEYRYPVLTAKQVHLWSPYTGPRFSIGIGVYRGF